MSKTLWIINETASTPKVGYAGRWYYLSKYLVRLGYKVYLISSSFSHIYRNPPNIKGEFEVNLVEGINFVWLKVPHYKNSFDKKRILNWFIFNYKLKKLPEIIHDKPDFVIVSSPSPVASLGGRNLANKFGAKFIFDVRDIWPLTLMEIGGYSKFHPFIMLLQWIENKAYKNCDLAISCLEKSVLHMESHGLDRAKFAWIPNGSDFEEMQNPEPLSKDILSQIPKDKFIIGYCGTLGEANGLKYFIEAAQILKDNDKISFLLVGDGKDKQKLLNTANGLKNIIFIDSIPKKSVQNILNFFDICYISILDKAIYKFGIAMNKIPDYLYASKPILYSFSGYGEDMIKFDFGFKIPAENATVLVQKIVEISNLPKEKLQQMGQNGKNYALGKYGYSQIALKIDELLSKFNN